MSYGVYHFNQGFYSKFRHMNIPCADLTDLRATQECDPQGNDSLCQGAEEVEGAVSGVPAASIFPTEAQPNISVFPEKTQKVN